MGDQVQKVPCPSCHRPIGTLTRNGVAFIANHYPKAGVPIGFQQRCPGSRTVISRG